MGSSVPGLRTRWQARCVQGTIYHEPLVPITSHSSTYVFLLTAKPVITTDMLDGGIQVSSDLYGLYHYTSHLQSGRDVTDSPAQSLLTADIKQRLNVNICKALERNMQSCCVSSLSELCDIINQIMAHWSVFRSGHPAVLLLRIMTHQSCVPDDQMRVFK